MGTDHELAKYLGWIVKKYGPVYLRHGSKSQASDLAGYLLRAKFRVGVPPAMPMQSPGEVQRWTRRYRQDDDWDDWDWHESEWGQWWRGQMMGGDGGQMMGGAAAVGGQMTGRPVTGHLAEEATAGGTTARHMAGGSGRRIDDPPPGQDLHLDAMLAKLVGQARSQMAESTAQSEVIFSERSMKRALKNPKVSKIQPQRSIFAL